MLSPAAPAPSQRQAAGRPDRCISSQFGLRILWASSMAGACGPLMIVDNFSRVSPFIGLEFRYKGHDVVTALSLAVAQYGVPKRIRVDNGPGLISKEGYLGAFGHGVALVFSQPESLRHRLPRKNCLLNIIVLTCHLREKATRKRGVFLYIFKRKTLIQLLERHD